MLTPERIDEIMKMSESVAEEVAEASREREEASQKQLAALNDIRDTLSRILDFLERKL